MDKINILISKLKHNMDKIIIVIVTIASSILVFSVLLQLSLEPKTVLATGGVAIGAIIGIMKFYLQQKSRHNLEFSKLLNEFEDKWTNARTNWKSDPNKKDLDSCYAMCAKRLSVLDSLAFLTDSNKIDKDMMKYFTVHFSEGMLYLKWTGDIEPLEKNTWKHFSTYVKNTKPKTEMASEKLLPEEFHDVYREKTKNEFKSGKLS